MVHVFNTSYSMVSAVSETTFTSNYLRSFDELEAEIIQGQKLQVQDMEGVELCGTLKNVVAIAAGCNYENWSEGSKLLFPSVKDTTFFESCGVTDLITTCLLDGIQVYTKLRSSLLLPSSPVQCFAPNLYCCPSVGGRNRECAGAFARNGGKSCILNESFDELEAEMLQGQKLQGVLTAKEVYEVLSHRGWLKA
ncbi:glycerol-3-phosphate dehydrogenase [NAD(+)]-like [Olea europaea var. sylvestris]|uniref:glycerol-3-phosphate dehydrogenase [NAD(+)]-like n=1 Tax=Olea europaea var. sylvestris TaxID=158386 RepID=UPI000C1CD320|nr:glycerol-3-phosphate dehydrogenase [NAD(+)]-like [Olea europaea var. sylvestris]